MAEGSGAQCWQSPCKLGFVPLCPCDSGDYFGGSDSGGAWRWQCLLASPPPPLACEQRQLLGPSGWQNQQASCLGAEGRGPQTRRAMMVAGSVENQGSNMPGGGDLQQQWWVAWLKESAHIHPVLGCNWPSSQGAFQDRSIFPTPSATRSPY